MATPDPRPLNIVIVNPDQMRGDYCSHAGHPFIGTRHLSRLAAMGTPFNKAFAANPMCAPSRSSFVTGLYPMQHGVRDFGPSLDARHPNALVNLGRAGYRRALHGKDHVLRETVGGPQAIGTFYDEGESISLGNLADHPDNHASYASGLLAADSKWNLSERLATAGIAFIRRQAAARRPFFLTLNFQDPHPYFCCPEPYASLFSPEQFSLPPNFRLDPDPREPRRLTLWREHSRHREASEREMLALMAIYCGQIRYVDDQLGRVLDALGELDLLGRTIVLFWSDHGEYLNDFGVTHKQATFYDCLMRVPMVLWDPTGRVARGPNDDLVEAMDVMATVLDLAGVTQPDGSKAWSLLSPGYLPRADVFGDGGLYRIPPSEPIAGLRLRGALAPTAYGPGAMLRNHAHKLCVSAFDGPELYDLRDDPHETRNLAGDPARAAIQAQLTERLMARMLCRGQAPEHLPRWGNEVVSG
ncbi:MAG: sulfatase-like hydrolase/transferase [Caldimonas sp.]